MKTEINGNTKSIIACEINRELNMIFKYFGNTR